MKYSKGLKFTYLKLNSTRKVFPLILESWEQDLAIYLFESSMLYFSILSSIKEEHYQRQGKMKGKGENRK